MSIVEILVPFGGKGGVEKVVNTFAVYLKSCGYGVRVVQMVYNGGKWVDDSIEFYPLLINKKVDSLVELIPVYKEALSNIALPDIIIATPWPFLCVVAKKAEEMLGVNIPVVSWMHGPLEMYKAYGQGGLECLSMADAHFAINNKIGKQLLVCSKKENIFVVHNPVNFSKCRYIERNLKSAGTLLYVGRLSPEKNVMLILQAIRMVIPEWKLRIIGDGEQRTEIQQFIYQHNMTEYVSIDGWSDNPWQNTEDAAALIVASEYEGFGLAAVEALACGIPVITTPVDGLTDYIIPGTNGYFYSNNSPEELSEILELIKSGVLPELSSAVCRDSVLRFEKEMVLKYMRVCLEELL